MISVIIISKNEEDVIEECILSIKGIADEILLIDDSTDKTPEIADELGARVIKHAFENFSDQRNFGAKEARNDWILYLDSDERATPAFLKELKEKLKNSPEIPAFFIRRKTFYFGKDWGIIDKVERVFRKDKLKRWHGVVHETPDIDGKPGIIDEPIMHFTHRNLSQMLEKTNKWSVYEAELRFEAGHPQMTWWRFFRVIITGFLKSFVKEKGYRNGTAGVIEAAYQAFSMFITYSKLWEMQNKKS